MATVNLVLYDWATIVSKLLSTADPAYKINGMYIEFDNSNSTVTPPTPTRDGGIEYYQDLGTARDYLRVPLIAATSSSSDSVKFPGGNELTFFAQTQGSTGVLGLDFSESTPSVVYGGALVSIVDPDDRTQDLIFSRFYLDEAEQQVKYANSQIGLNIKIAFE